MSKARRNHRHQPVLGSTCVHTVIDEHSRLAYAAIHDDETAQTATGVLRLAVGWFGARGVTVERVLSDNGACCTSYA
jgi:Integrase core domain